MPKLFARVRDSDGNVLEYLRLRVTDGELSTMKVRDVQEIVLKKYSNATLRCYPPGPPYEEEELITTYGFAVGGVFDFLLSD